MVREFPIAWVQLGLALAALCAFAFAPPAQGRMLLVPLTAAAADSAAASARASGALLLGRGPLPGSLVVMGVRDDFGALPLAGGILIMSAPVLLCGAQPGDASA